MKITEILEDKTDYHQLDIISSKAFYLAQKVINNLLYLEKIYFNIDDVLNWNDLVAEQDRQIAIFKENLDDLIPRLRSLYPMESAKSAVEELSSKYSTMIIKRSKLNK